MTDATFKIRKNGTEVLLATERIDYRTVYILTVITQSTLTKDRFDDFDEAFDSFSNIVKTLTK